MYSYPPLLEGKLLRRYKRFFADVETKDGVITVHNPNTGSMKSLLEPDNPVLYSINGNPKRKLPGTLELIEVKGEWIVSNTIRVNRIVESALKSGSVPQLFIQGTIRREYAYHDSRIDFFIDNGVKPALVEVKSVTYFDEKGSYFPDAVTTRGRKHLHTLMLAVKEGYRAVMLYVCMAGRPAFACAAHVDPEYCRALTEAATAGVEIMTVNNRFDRAANSSSVTPAELFIS